MPELTFFDYEDMFWSDPVEEELGLTEGGWGPYDEQSLKVSSAYSQQESGSDYGDVYASYLDDPSQLPSVSSGKTFWQKAADFGKKVLKTLLGPADSTHPSPSFSGQSGTKSTTGAAQRAKATAGIGGMSTGLVLALLLGVGALVYFLKGK